MILQNVDPRVHRLGRALRRRADARIQGLEGGTAYAEQAVCARFGEGGLYGVGDFAWGESLALLPSSASM